MKVAVMFSGGKDSCFAAKHAMEKWTVKKLIAVKPANTEAYLYHFATVEHTPLQAAAMNLPITLLHCDAAGPKEEAAILKPVLETLKEKNEIDAVVLGGVGLQETQIREISAVAEKAGLKVIVPHSSLTSEHLLKKEIDAGMEIVLTEAAAAGLTREMLGMKISAENFEWFKALAEKNGFDVLGEGGAYNTFVTDAPWFSARIDFTEAEKVWDASTRSGYLLAKARLQKKILV